MDEGGSKDEARLTTAQPAGQAPELLRLGLLGRQDPTSTSRRDRAEDNDPLCQGINQVPFYCTDNTRSEEESRRSIRSTGCRLTPTATAAADDQGGEDHNESVPNITEYLQEIASPFKDASTASSTPASRTPTRASAACSAAPTSTATGSRTADDTDDNRGKPTRSRPTLRTIRCAPTATAMAPRTATSCWFALGENGAAEGFPGKVALPQRARRDRRQPGLSDGDGLTLKQEYQAWNYSGRPLPLNYSDGNPKTGGAA